MRPPLSKPVSAAASPRATHDHGGVGVSSAWRRLTSAANRVESMVKGRVRVSRVRGKSACYMWGFRSQINTDSSIATFWSQIPAVRRGARGLGLRPEATLGLRLIPLKRGLAPPESCPVAPPAAPEAPRQESAPGRDRGAARASEALSSNRYLCHQRTTVRNQITAQQEPGRLGNRSSAPGPQTDTDPG